MTVLLYDVFPTKLEPPRRRPGVVVRERLLKQLDDVLTRPLGLVCAPAGSGKSTLLAQWLTERQLAAAWLSLEPEDDSPLAFLRGLLAALAPHIEGLEGHAPAAALNPKASNLTTLVGAWIATPLACQPGGELVLVLDDVHVLTHPEVLAALGALIARAPARLDVVLGSRTEPALPLARLRVRGQVTVIDRHQLRFGQEEARAFYNTTMSLELSEADVRVL
ncbi:MAG: AAA family ATPase, partial [Myxococcota bacterium]